MVTGIELITAERRRQVDQKGYSVEHDDQHTDETLALVAALYATPCPLYDVDVDDDRKSPLLAVRGVSIEVMDPWPSEWGEMHDKRGKLSRIRQLEIAGALIAAELDRLLRVGEVPPG